LIRLNKVILAFIHNMLYNVTNKSFLLFILDLVGFIVALAELDV